MQRDPVAMLNPVLSIMYICSPVYISPSSPAVMGTNKYLSIYLTFASVIVRKTKIKIILIFFKQLFDIEYFNLKSSQFKLQVKSL